jgi:hypothetical protein
LVSGSSQITFGSISSIPGGIVSGSSQIDLTATTNYSSGIKTRLNVEGVVSGSSQITISSTTGYGSVINQAVLTSSSPTFAGLTLGTEFTSNDVNGYSRFTESNGSAQVGLFRSGTSSGGVYIGGDSDFFRVYTANFGSVLMSISQSTGAISGSSFTGAGTGLTGTASSLSIGGNAATATTATTAGALTSMNISQFTNNSNYITGISFANVSSKPTTISGYGITDAITTTNISSQSVSYANTAGSTTFLNNVSNYSWASSTLPTSYPQGLQLGFVGPSAGEGSWQNYGTVLTARTYSGGGGSLQMYVPYGPSNGGDSLQVRFGNYNVSSGNSWTGWKTLIDSGNISSQSVSYASTAGNISAYTINQNLGTGNSVKFGAFVDINSSASAFRFYDGSAFRGGIGLDDWAHSGSAANVTVYATGVLHFTSGATKRAYFNTSGHFLPDANSAYDLGATGNRWRTIYTSDLSLSNGIGDYTIVEGEEKLYLYNNKNNKVYSFVLQEEDPTTATPKLPQ